MEHDVAALLTQDGPLLVCAELHARSHTPRQLIETFLNHVDVALDPSMTPAIWAEAGRANADYHARRRGGGLTGQRPVLPDFLIGAHALHSADRLFTLHPGDFSDFSTLNVVTL